jgi:hypothetical protein
MRLPVCIAENQKRKIKTTLKHLNTGQTIILNTFYRAPEEKEIKNKFKKIDKLHFPLLGFPKRELMR